MLALAVCTAVGKPTSELLWTSSLQKLQTTYCQTVRNLWLQKYANLLRKLFRCTCTASWLLTYVTFNHVHTDLKGLSVTIGGNVWMRNTSVGNADWCWSSDFKGTDYFSVSYRLTTRCCMYAYMYTEHLARVVLLKAREHVLRLQYEDVITSGDCINTNYRCWQSGLLSKMNLKRSQNHLHKHCSQLHVYIWNI